MGPHFFKCGKLSTLPLSTLLLIGFNGAALFQVRKGRTSSTTVRTNGFASMGPHFFKCGKLAFLVMESSGSP